MTAGEGEPGSPAAGRPRPPWWVEAAGRDEIDDQRDERAAKRDEAGTSRDEAARSRRRAAVQRDQDASDLVLAAHNRFDATEDADVDALVEAESLHNDGQLVERARLGVSQEHPELAAALARMQDHIEAVYVALLRSGVHRDQARADLRSIAQLLAAAASDRQAAEDDRIHAEADRQAAGVDRDNARTGRQQSAMYRAPRSRDA